MLTATDILLYNRDFVYACNFLGLTRPEQLLGDILSGLASSYAAPVADLPALRLILPAERTDKQVRLVESEGTLYRYDSSGVGLDDGAGTITPGDAPVTGRWFRVSASFIPPYLVGNAVDGPAAVSVIVDSPAYVNAGAKLLSIRNGTVEKAYVDYNGSARFGTGVAIDSSGSVTASGTQFGYSMVRSTADTMAVYGQKPDGATAVGTVLDNQIPLTTAGAKLTSIRNNTVEQAYVGKSGSLGLGVGAPLIIYPQEAVPTACVVGAISAGGGVDDGTHTYKYTFVTPEGESLPSLVSNNAVTGAGSNTVALSGILPGSSRVTSRKIYRNSIGVPGTWRLLQTIAGNITTTASDVATDASIAAAAVAPAANTTSNVQLSGVADSAGAIGHVFDTAALAAGGSKLVSFKVNNSEMAYINRIGDGFFANGVSAQNGFRCGWATGGSTVGSFNTTGPLALSGLMTDGAAAIGVSINTPAYAAAGAKLLSIQNDSVEKACIDYAGNIFALGFSANSGLGNISALTIAPASGQSISVVGSIADGAAAIGVKIKNENALSIAGAKICSFYKDNGVTEKLSIDKDGYLSATVIKGQRDLLTSFTPADASTVTLDYSVGNAFYIDCSALNAAHSFTIAVSNVPGAGLMSTITVCIFTGAALPTINYAATMNNPGVLTVSKRNYLTLVSVNAGTNIDTSWTGAF